MARRRASFRLEKCALIRERDAWNVSSLLSGDQDCKTNHLQFKIDRNDWLQVAVPISNSVRKIMPWPGWQSGRKRQNAL